MYAYFDVDQHTMLIQQELVRAGKVKTYKEMKVPLFLGLENEADFPHRGHIDYVNNKVTSGTGTINVRGIFPNPDRALTAGGSVRVRVQIGLPYKALLVSERALGTEQGQKYLLLVGADNKVTRRDVQVGTLQNGLRVITEGLRPGEWVIVDGLQRVRPGVTVAPERQPMPERPAAGAAAAAAVRPAAGKPSKR
jgi:RND family efflux transporter MFP subunit